MLDYGLRILALSALISVVTALLFLAVRRLIVLPIRRVVRHMQPMPRRPRMRRVITHRRCRGRAAEAEEALQSMQTQLTGGLRQKERLAQLGSAVAKISHDLRNILTTAQLFRRPAGRQRRPRRARAAPKLVARSAAR
jgi:signal transduction histidine kinase